MLLKGLYFIVFNHSRYEHIAGTGSIEHAKPFRKHLVQSLVKEKAPATPYACHERAALLK
jgi:hypothetical protein